MKKIISEVDSLNDNEEIFYDYLAKELNEEKSIPIDVREYMMKNKEVQNVIRIAKKKNIDKNFWNEIEKNKYYGG